LLRNLTTLGHVLLIALNRYLIQKHYYDHYQIPATAVYCEAMPPPRLLEISRTIAVQDEEDEQLVRLQRLIETFSARNRIFLDEVGKAQVCPKIVLC
jgi:7-keto-8-aminopelargonate synthetase-like enzyme